MSLRRGLRVYLRLRHRSGAQTADSQRTCFFDSHRCWHQTSALLHLPARGLRVGACRIEYRSRSARFAAGADDASTSWRVGTFQKDRSRCTCDGRVSKNCAESSIQYDHEHALGSGFKGRTGVSDNSMQCPQSLPPAIFFTESFAYEHSRSARRHRMWALFSSNPQP